ncbi:MAG: PaaX family transcriptional regulator C-terminal domain-containing protein [Actinomycetota bacterium]
MTDRASAEPSTAALVLFGDWFAPHRPSFWLGELLGALDAVGINPRSARTVAQRFANAGWFDVERVGRRSRYTSTPTALDELARGDLRILDPPQGRPADRWTLVSVDAADLDPAVEKRLRWLGLGELRRGLWLSPFVPDDALDAVLGDRSHEVFVDAHVDGRNGDLVERCWDLAAAEDAYRTFLTRHDDGGRGPTDHREAFVQRFALNHDFLLAVRVDPQLPADLLPPGWPGTAARSLFERRRAELEEPARCYLTGLADHHDDLARRSPAAV